MNRRKLQLVVGLFTIVLIGLGGLFLHHRYYAGTGIVSKIYIRTEWLASMYMEKSTGYVECSVRIEDEEGNEIIDNDAKIKIRGNSTAYGKKKPYTIKLSEPQSLLGGEQSKSWALLAECFDSTLLRNYLALNLAEEIGLKNTPECKYVELWIDGIYKGCYLLADKVGSSSNGLDLDEQKGDFLISLEMNRTDDDNPELRYFDSGCKSRYEIIKPDNPDVVQTAEIKRIIDELYDMLASEEDYSQVSQLVDMDSFARFYLVNEFSKSQDFSKHSVNMYYKNGILYAGPVWDFDLNFGNVSYEHRPDYYLDGEDSASFEGFYCNKHFFRELLKYDAFRMLVASYFEEYSGAFENVFNNEIDAALSEFGQVFERNYLPLYMFGAGWDVSKNYCVQYERNPLPTFEDNIEYLKEWTKNRFYWLSNNIIYA